MARVIEYNKDTGKWELEETSPAPITGTLEQNVGSQLANMNIMGIPVGEAGLGLAVAGLGDILVRLLARFIPGLGVAGNIRNAVLLGIGAFAVASQPVRNVIGRDGANVGALFLAADALAQVINPRAIVRQFGAGLTAAIPGLNAAATTTTTDGNNSSSGGGNTGSL